MARPNKGVSHVMKLPGDREAKRRVELIHRTMAGQMSVDDVCAELGISPSRFDQLRTRMLLASIAELSPRPVGRPRSLPEEVKQEVESLREQVADLERENHLLKVQAEVSGLSRGKRVVRSKSAGSAASRTPPPRSHGAGGAIP